MSPTDDLHPDDAPRPRPNPAPAARDDALRRKRILARALGLDPSAVRAVNPVLRSHRVSDAAIRAWLSQPRFRKRLRALRRELAARRELELSRGARNAARRLSAAALRILDDFGDLQRRVCVDLIKLARAHPRRRRPRPLDPEGPLISPDLAPDVAERLIRELDPGDD